VSNKGEGDAENYELALYIEPARENIMSYSDKKSSKIIKTNLVSSEKNKYIWESGENIVINITTTYGDAWIEYLNKTLTIGANLIWDFDSTGAFQGDYYMTTTQITDELTNIKLILNSIYKLECVIGIVAVELN